MNTDGVARHVGNNAANRGAILAVSALALAAALAAGATATVVVVLLLSFLFAWGLPGLAGIPAREGSSIVVVGVAVACAVDVIAFPDHEMTPTILALSVIAAFLQQMFRRDGRPRLVEAVSVTVTGALVVVAASGWTTVRVESHGVVLGLVIIAAMVAAAAPTFFPLPGPVVIGLALLLSTGVAAGLGAVVPAVEVLHAAGLGFAVGVVFTSVHVILQGFPTRLAPQEVAAGALMTLLGFGLPVAHVVQLL